MLHNTDRTFIRVRLGIQSQWQLLLDKVVQCILGIDKFCCILFHTVQLMVIGRASKESTRSGQVFLFEILQQCLILATDDGDNFTRKKKYRVN